MGKKFTLSKLIKNNAIPLIGASMATFLIASILLISQKESHTITKLTETQKVGAYGVFGSQPIKKYNDYYITDSTGKPTFMIGYYAWGSMNPDSYVDHPAKYLDQILWASENGLDYIRLELGMNRLVLDANESGNVRGG